MLYDTHDASYIITMNSSFAEAFYDWFVSMILYNSMSIQFFVTYKRRRWNKNTTVP